MLALHLRPKPSKQCAVCLGVLQAALMCWLCVFWQGLGFWLGMAVCLGLSVGSWRQWRYSADYDLDIRADGQVWLRWRHQSPIAVQRKDGSLISRFMCVATWQDAQGHRYQTVLWPDSVSAFEFKMAYVWLRWQPVPQKEKKQ